MPRPLYLATAALLAVHAFWLACTVLDAPGVGFAAAMLWVAVPLAAFAVALAVRTRKFLTGLAVAAPATLLFVFSNACLQAFGHTVDFPGVLGALFVFGMSLPVLALLAAVGAGLALLSPFQAVWLWPATAAKWSRSSQTLRFRLKATIAAALRVRPNPSLEATLHGLALGPRGAHWHHAPRGPSANPRRSPQLKR